MFRREKRKEEAVEPAASVETPVAEETPKAAGCRRGLQPVRPISEAPAEVEPASVAAENAAPAGDTAAGNAAKSARARGNRVQKVGIVSSDKMQKTVVVRVDRLCCIENIGAMCDELRSSWHTMIWVRPPATACG